MLLYDDRYGYPGKFVLRKCSSCNHKFLEHDFSPGQINSLYTSYYPRSSFSLDKFRPRKDATGFQAWLNGNYASAYLWVPPGVRVLDIGCGFGETLAYHALRGCDAYGVEVDENIKRVAERFAFKVHVGPFTPEIYEPGFFDYVTMDQVLEHVFDPLETLRGVMRILKPGGQAIISTPNSNGWGAFFFGKQWINWHTPYHLHHFSAQSIKLAAQKAGLTLEQVKTITSSEWLHYQWIHLMLFPKIGKQSVFWSTTSKKQFHEKVLLKILSTTHQTKINHLISRFFDLIGFGDNYLFFLKKDNGNDLHSSPCP